MSGGLPSQHPASRARASPRTPTRARPRAGCSPHRHRDDRIRRRRLLPTEYERSSAVPTRWCTPRLHWPHAETTASACAENRRPKPHDTPRPSRGEQYRSWSRPSSFFTFQTRDQPHCRARALNIIEHCVPGHFQEKTGTGRDRVRNPDRHRAVRIDRSLRPPYVRLHYRR